MDKDTRRKKDKRRRRTVSRADSDAEESGKRKRRRRTAARSQSGSERRSRRRRTAEPSEPESEERPRRRHPDIELASIAVKQGFVLEADAKAALREVKTRVRAGKPRVPLLQLFLDRGYLLEDRVSDLKRELERHTYICDQCERRCILAPSRSKSGYCPRCGAIIETFAPAVSDRSQTRSLMDTEREQSMPDVPGLARLLRTKELAFNRYQLLEELGRGAMGVVYKARHVDLKKNVALKLLLAGVGATRSHVTRFRREAAAVARLNHPNIVRVFDFGVEDDMHFLSMDLVEGGHSLHTALKEEGLLDLRQRLEIIATVADAMQHAHEHGVIHRDLKPANVLLDPNLKPLVADFGLAKDFEEDDELTQPEARVGTPLFLAPELVHKGSTAVDARADVWSMGVMIFLSVTGRYPFRAKTVMELYVQVLQEEPDWDGRRIGRLVASADEATTRRLQQPFTPTCEDFPQDLALICNKALSKHPEYRYQSAGEVAEDLRRFLRGEPITVRPPSFREKMRLALRRRPTMLAFAGAGALAAIALLTLLLVTWQVRKREELTRVKRLEAARDAWSPAVKDRLAFTNQGFTKALDALEAANRVSPDHAPTLHYRGLARLHLFDDANAEKDLRRALAGAQPEFLDEVRLSLALLLLFRCTDASLDEAASLTATGHPEDPDFERRRLLLRSRIHLARGTDVALKTALQELGALADPDTELTLAKAAVLGRLGRWEALLKTADGILAEVPSHLRAQIAREFALLRLEDPNIDAPALAKQLTGRQKQLAAALPNFTSYYFQAARKMVDDGEKARAFEAFRRASLLTWWFAPAWWGQAWCLEELAYEKGLPRPDGRPDQLDRAVRLYAVAQRLMPDEREINTDLTRWLRLACDPSSLDFAITTLHEERLWKSKGAYRHLRDEGVMLYTAGKLDKAFKALDRARRRVNETTTSLFLVAIARQQKRPDLDDYLGYLETAESADSDKPGKIVEAYVTLARAELIRSRLEPIPALLERARLFLARTKPKYRELRTAELKAVEAGFLARRNQKDQALALLEPAIEHHGLTLYELERMSAFESFDRARLESLRQDGIKAHAGRFDGGEWDFDKDSRKKRRKSRRKSRD